MWIDKDLNYQFEYLGYEKLLSHIVFLAESDIIDQGKFNHSVISIISDIRKQKKLPVLNLSTNPVIIDQVCHDLSQIFDPGDYFVLNPDCRPEKNLQKNIAHWPSALLLQQIANNNLVLTFKKTYRISALMRQTRLHRLHLWQAIKTLATDCDVVVANSVIGNNLPLDVQRSKEAMTWIKELPWSNNTNFLDLQFHPKSDYIYTNVNHPAYRAKINITNESWAENNLIFLTEKTWKAYATGCMVVNYGSTHVPDQLKNLGFAIWEEYDACLPCQEKILKIVEIFQRDDIDQLYNKNLDMIAHNQSLATSWYFAKQMAAPAIEKIQGLV